MDQQVDESVGICSLFEQDHKHQTYCQSVCHIGQKVDGLEQIPQGFDRAQCHRDQQSNTGRQGYRNDYHQKCVFYCLQKVGVMQHIRKIVEARIKKSL